MAVHYFVLIVDPAPTPVQRRLLTGRHHDLVVGPRDRSGLGRVSVRRPAVDLVEALVTAVRDVEAIGLRPVRVGEPDWVTLGEVAERVGRSREIVRLWAIGRHGPGRFPPPLNPGRSTSYYSWTEVARWLSRELGYQLPQVEPAVRAASLVLQLRALAPRVRRLEVVVALLRPVRPAGADIGTGDLQVEQPRPRYLRLAGTVRGAA